MYILTYVYIKYITISYTYSFGGRRLWLTLKQRKEEFKKEYAPIVANKVGSYHS